MQDELPARDEMRLQQILEVKNIDILTYQDGWFAFDRLGAFGDWKELFPRVDCPKYQLASLIWLAHEIFWIE